MGVDYYEILKVNKSASEDDLKKSYRRLAMKWHPDKNPNNKNDAEATFKHISQAYDVLSDPEKRASYDQYGEEGLNDIIPPNCGGFNSRNAEDIFAEFFGSSPFRFGGPRTARSYSRFQSDSAAATAATPTRKKPPPVESKLPCSLKELYSGSTRKMKISRTVADTHGRQAQETEILTIDVKPGWKKGTKVTFPDKGNEQPNQLPADLVFIIDEKPHDVYKRDGSDLVINHRVTLAEALGGTTVKITTLDGRSLLIPVDDIISPGYEVVVAMEGMPIAKEPGNRGDLRIRFDVKFPTKLTTEQRAGIKRVFEVDAVNVS
ncbi:DnaJ homolog subfamily B member 1 [Linum perenne]